MAPATRLEEALAGRMLREHPAEAALLLERLDAGDRLALLAGHIDAEQAAAVLQRMERSQATSCLASWPLDREPGRVVAALNPGHAARLLRPLEAGARAGILAACTDRVADRVRRLLGYDGDTAGAMMDADPPAAPEDLTVEACRRLVAERPGRTGGQIFVVSREGVLLGRLELEELLRGPVDSPLSSLMLPAPSPIRARARRDVVASHPGWRDHHTLPVVDRGGVLVGTIGHSAMYPVKARSGQHSIGLELGEMYWLVVSAMMEGIGRSLTPPGRSSREAER